MTLEEFKLKQYRLLSKELRAHMSNLLAHRAGANEVTLGFLDALEDKHQAKLNMYKTRIYMYTPRKDGVETGLVSPSDIARAKLVPISTFLKVPGSKKVACLFHADKNPSMHIYGTTYYCFVCSAKGSVVDIVMKLYNRSFTSAVKYLIGR